MPGASSPELVVTNFNRNFTGVSATADQLLRFQERSYDVLLAGFPLPAVQAKPVAFWKAIALSRKAPSNRPCVLWHLRRNSEMLWAIIARDILRFPIKTVFTSAAIRRHSAFPRFLISKMDAVIATTQKAADFVPNVRAIVPHGVDTARFHPVEDRAAAWKATGFPGERGIATIGRVRPEKGVDLFVNAMLRILPKHPGVTALVIGKRDAKYARFESELKRSISEAGLEDRILFLGEINKEDLPDLVAALSLVVAVPRYEGYGMTPLEAMASATPVVVSDTGAFASFVSSGKCGTLVPIGDVKHMCESIDAILGDPEHAAALAQGAREVACSEFSVTRELEGVAQVYEGLWQSENGEAEIAA